MEHQLGYLSLSSLSLLHPDISQWVIFGLFLPIDSRLTLILHLFLCLSLSSCILSHPLWAIVSFLWSFPPRVNHSPPFLSRPQLYIWSVSLISITSLSEPVWVNSAHLNDIQPLQSCSEILTFSCIFGVHICIHLQKHSHTLFLHCCNLQHPTLNFGIPHCTLY